MVVENSSSTREELLAQSLQRQIHRGTWGRIQGLQVELCGDRVIIHGSSPSYHLIQLALLAIRLVLPSRAVELDIQVLHTRSHAPEEYHGREGPTWWRQDRARAGPFSGSGKVPG
jgi:hypothetical protein